MEVYIIRSDGGSTVSCICGDTLGRQRDGSYVEHLQVLGPGVRAFLCRAHAEFIDVAGPAIGEAMTRWER